MTDFDAAREAMVDCQVRPADVTGFPVIQAMLAVPREVYVPDALRPVAYSGTHLDLGEGRWMLDPRTYAKMIDALSVRPTDLVLDVGCGLGYSSAVLARMAQAVIALEAEAGIADQAEENFATQNVENAIVERGPLEAGAPKHGPYDAIIVEGAVEEIPEALIDQLKAGGHIVAIFENGPHSGQARLGHRIAGGVVWRRIFDATAPALTGFQMERTFEF